MEDSVGFDGNLDRIWVELWCLVRCSCLSFVRNKSNWYITWFAVTLGWQGAAFGSSQCFTIVGHALFFYSWTCWLSRWENTRCLFLFLANILWLSLLWIGESIRFIRKIWNVLHSSAWWKFIKCVQISEFFGSKLLILQCSVVYWRPFWFIGSHFGSFFSLIKYNYDVPTWDFYNQMK